MTRSLAEMADGLRWDPGMARSLRPAFRELGHVAAVTEAVELLSAYGLPERADGAPTARPGRLVAVAELLGAVEAVVTQHRRYAPDRARWRAFLARREADEPAGLEYVVDEDWWRPPDDEVGWTLMQMVA